MTRVPARFQISMVLAMLLGLAYLGWLAWAEGWRLWVVFGVMVLVAALGGAVHMVMGMARQRDGLDGRASGEIESTEGAEADGESS